LVKDYTDILIYERCWNFVWQLFAAAVENGQIIGIFDLVVTCICEQEVPIVVLLDPNCDILNHFITVAKITASESELDRILEKIGQNYPFIAAALSTSRVLYMLNSISQKKSNGQSKLREYDQFIKYLCKIMDYFINSQLDDGTWQIFIKKLIEYPAITGRNAFIQRIENCKHINVPIRDISRMGYKFPICEQLEIYGLFRDKNMEIDNLGNHRPTELLVTPTISSPKLQEPQLAVAKGIAMSAVNPNAFASAENNINNIVVAQQRLQQEKRTTTCPECSQILSYALNKNTRGQSVMMTCPTCNKRFTQDPNKPNLKGKFCAKK